jgi:hypothetical protein
MNEWLNVSPVRFPRRMIRLEIPYHECCDEWQELHQKMRQADCTPGVLEEWFREKLVQHRPDWQDASILSMHFDHARRAFMFTIEHLSLPIVPDGEWAPSERLLWDKLESEGSDAETATTA